jgi:hypothetical protein
LEAPLILDTFDLGLQSTEWLLEAA